MQHYVFLARASNAAEENGSAVCEDGESASVSVCVLF